MNRILLLAVMLLHLRSAAGNEILVFAAASLSDALQEIGRNHEKDTGTKVKFSFAASSVLARQIQEGARADIFFSADEEKMDALQKLGLAKNETRRSLLSNRLVVVVSRESELTLVGPADLKRARRIAVAEPATVPAGIYARRYLEAVGIWKSLKVLPTENVRAALLVVESGNAEAAIVYRTDAVMGKQTRVAFEIPSHPEITISYPVAIMKEARNPTGAESFMAELRSPRGLSIFQRHGFIVHANEGLEGSHR